MIKKLLGKTFIDQPNVNFLLNNAYARRCQRNCKLSVVELCNKNKKEFV